MGILTPKEVNVVLGVPWKIKCHGRHRGCPGNTTGVLRELVRAQEKLCDTIKGWYLHSGTLVTREDQGVIGGDEETPLSVVRLCGMGVPPSEACIQLEVCT